MNTDMKFGERLKLLRIEKNMKQDELAKKLHLSASEISAYEKGKRAPSCEILLKIARHFSVSLDYLFGISDKDYVNLNYLSEENRLLVFKLISALKKSDNTNQQ